MVYADCPHDGIEVSGMNDSDSPVSIANNTRSSLPLYCRRIDFGRQPAIDSVYIPYSGSTSDASIINPVRKGVVWYV